MRDRNKKSIHKYMRSLHRDIGFFVIGLLVIYTLSGILLTYKNTSFLKYETLIIKTLSPNLNVDELRRALHKKKLKVLKENGDIIYFENGSYDRMTGTAKYTKKVLPFVLDKFTKLHKSSNSDSIHWFITFFAILILFLVISSFWMLKPGTKLFKRSIYITIAGVLVAIIMIFL